MRKNLAHLPSVVGRWQWLRCLWMPVGENLRFFCFMYLLGAVCIWSENAFGKVRGMFELYAELYILCALFLVFPARLRRWVRGFVAVALYLIAIVDLFCFSRFGSGITPMLLTDVLYTNPREATEALRSFVTLRSLWSPVLLAMLLAAVHLWVVFDPRCRVQTESRSRTADSKRPYLLCLFDFLRQPVKAPLMGLFAGVAFIGCSFSSVVNWRYFWLNYVEADSELEMQYSWQHPYTTAFYLPVYRLAQAVCNVRINLRSTKVLERNLGQTKVDSCNFRSPCIVLIIGEAYNRSHSQLYGYPLPTTPRQLTLARDSSIAVFTDVIAPYNQTSEVFRLMFSLYGRGCKGRWEDYPLLGDLFRRAGYGVSFMTNQFVESSHLDIWDYNGSSFLNSPRLSRAQFSHRNRRTHRYDMGLLEDYDSLSSFSTPHELLIFHLLGQHVNYADRFPPSFARFSAADYHRPKLTAADIRQLAAYDNATLYNDYVVTEIVRRFSRRDAIVIYVPDHGELVFDGGTSFGRTFDFNTANEAKQQLEIPFWIYASPLYKTLHPQVWMQVWKARTKPFMTDNLDQMLLYLAGISCKDYRPADNPLEPVYHSKRRRIAEEGWDYDRGKRLSSEQPSWLYRAVY